MLFTARSMLESRGVERAEHLMLTEWLRAAHSLWFDGGGGGDESSHGAREAHALHLVALALQDAIGKLTGALQPNNAGLAAAMHADGVAHGSEESDTAFTDFNAAAGLQAAPGGTGFRRLREAFASETECMQLRAAALAAMASGFRRGGQTTLSLVPELPERLAAAGVPSSYRTLFDVLERVRVAAEEDDAAAASCSAPCPVCGKRGARPAAALAHGETTGAAGKDASEADDEAFAPRAAQHLYHRGALLVRLLPPEAAEAGAPACWGLRALQEYWSAHVDQHNAAEYDVSSHHAAGGTYESTNAALLVISS